LAKGLKKYRSFERNENWIRAKQFYNEYFLKNKTAFQKRDDIQIGSWVTVISNKIPVKGQRYAEYYINGQGPKLGTFKVEAYSDYEEDAVYLYKCNLADVSYITLI